MKQSSEKPGLLHRLNRRLAAIKPVSQAFSWLLPRLDWPVLRWTGGKHSITEVFTGLETVTLSTTGAKSGLPRSTTLIPFWDGECAILIASNFGQKNHPAWHYNLKASPQATLTRKGQVQQYRASPAQGEQRERYFQLAVQSYPGYAAYRQRASHREIVVWVLTPIDTET
jgi:deazaflavin-dependent oxidoreductase (nitroreductase family)